MKNKSIVKRIMGIVVVALVLSWVVVSAAPIVFEPEQCITLSLHRGLSVLLLRHLLLRADTSVLERRRQFVRRCSGIGCQWAHPDDVGAARRRPSRSGAGAGSNPHDVFASQDFKSTLRWSASSSILSVGVGLASTHYPASTTDE